MKVSLGPLAGGEMSAEDDQEKNDAKERMNEREEGKKGGAEYLTIW